MVLNRIKACFLQLAIKLRIIKEQEGVTVATAFFGTPMSGFPLHVEDDETMVREISLFKLS